MIPAPTLWHNYSFIFAAPSRGPNDYLGHKDEFSATVLYTAIGMVLCDGKRTTKWPVVHAVLDSVLWVGLPILARKETIWFNGSSHRIHGSQYLQHNGK